MAKSQKMQFVDKVTCDKQDKMKYCSAAEMSCHHDFYRFVSENEDCDAKMIVHTNLE